MFANLINVLVVMKFYLVLYIEMYTIIISF